MDLWQAFVLGLVQGVTEYLPVSSSGHLVLVPFVFGFDKGPFVFDVLVQLGTLLGVVVYFFADLKDVARAMLDGARQRAPLATPESRFGWHVALATLPAVGLGLWLHDAVASAFASPRAALGFLSLTALLLTAGELLARRRKAAARDGDLSAPEALVVGFAQALALLPGVSRSGSTIAAAMMLGHSRERAARFSFVMSIPIMAGAGAMELATLAEDPAALRALALPIFVGFCSAALSGYVVIRWFLAFLKRQSLLWFAGYCAVVSVVGLWWTAAS